MQAFFKDGSEVVISTQDKTASYCSKEGIAKTVPLQSATEPDIKKRIKYIKSQQSSKTPLTQPKSAVPKLTLGSLT